MTVTLVGNPAGGAGGPTSRAESGSVTLVVEQVGSQQIVSGTVEAKLVLWKVDDAGLPIPGGSVILDGSWSCSVDGLAPAASSGP